MGQRIVSFKRTIILCAFFVAGCSQQDASSGSVINQTASSTSQKAQAPLASLHEMLKAADVQQGLAQAAAANDQDTLALWQEALLSAADEVYLAEKERSLISGRQGLQYLAFQGMKTNYQHAFERAFIEFEDVSQVYNDYPAFENLHKRSMTLVQQRDELVEKVRQQLEDDAYDGDALEEAKRQWQNFFLSQSANDFSHSN